jgi:hypothetical protein
MSFNPEINSQCSGSIICSDGIERRYNNPEMKERIEKLNKLMLKNRERRDFEMAKENQRTWNQNPHRETRDHEYTKYSTEEWAAGTNNGYVSHREIDPYDRDYQG